MLQFVLDTLPAFLFLFFFFQSSSSGKRANSDLEISIRIPKIMHKILFLGAPWKVRPLRSVIVTSSSLICTISVVISSIWTTFYYEGISSDKLIIYRFHLSIILSFFSVSVLIAWVVIALQMRGIPLYGRILIIALISFLFAYVLLPIIHLF